jgi:hypothetical protein
MKKAIILVGAHHVGKSLTINQHLKPMLKISHDAHVFQLGGKTGFVLSQSAEEAERDVEVTVEKYADYDLLVLAARPYSNPESSLKLLRSLLQKASFVTTEVAILSTKEAPRKAIEIFAALTSH